ncbi:MAG: hybrid sensor histidine kinase/response regulator [Chloroflexi bacterium]|nr:hybrid sensor histidine kinase/response regulator [Chloroflexota bacterium]
MPTILFVDDNEALVRSVDRLLQVEGYATLLAFDGEQALQLLEDMDPLPDLIISDIMMPRMDGFELFRAVREQDRWMSIPFLFLTARDQIDDLRAGYALGADDYLVKPLDQERLLMIIDARLKRQQQMLEHIYVQQHALDMAKRDLTLMIAHELRTPLVSINMITEILAREIETMDPGQVQGLLETMRSGSMRLTRLIEQMVLYVQLESGALASAIERFGQPGLLHDAIQGAISRARQYSLHREQVDIVSHVAAPGVLIGGDVIALQHVIAEVLLNAIAFSRAGDDVVVGEWAEDGIAWVTVSDSGPGIAAKEWEQVFQPYYQVNRQKHEQQGIGIGLTLVKGVIEAHGGQVMLEAVSGRGTIVTIQLPQWFDEDAG